MEKTINITLKVWRQAGPKAKGRFETYKLNNISTDSSFLEMLDVLNEQLVRERKEPVAFDHDCREGICGMCSLYINGHPHGPDGGVTTCQLHMRKFKDGETITVEPWRSHAFPIIKDLMVDRGAYDKIMQAGGYVSVYPMPTLSRFRKPKPTRLWMLPRASDVALALLRAKMARLCCLWLPKSVSWHCCRKAKWRLLRAPKPCWPKWTNSGLATAPTRVLALPNVRKMCR